VKRVLLICFDFPPRRSSGVYRPLGLMRYLPQYGWEPTVITVQEREEDIRDLTLLEKLPSQLQVVRTPYLRVSAWENPSAGVLEVTGGRARWSEGTRRSQLYGYLRSLARVARSYLYFPDETVGWIPFGFAEAVEQIFRQRYDVIYTTSPQSSTATLGLLLKLVVRIPWVAEFRDPLFLPNDVLHSLNWPEALATRRRLEHWLRAGILRRADTVLTVTDGYAQELKSSYNVPPRKLAVVTNGFDEVDFKAALNGSRDFFPAGYVHLTHLGTIYPHFSVNFFPALREFLRESSEARQKLRLNIIGYPDGEVLQYAQEDDLKDIVTIRSFINQTDALRAMCSSDCLLLFYGHRYISRVCVPGKIYDFLRVGRPILAITYEGGLKALIERGGAGWAVNPEDKEAIKQALRRVLHDGRRSGPPRPFRPEIVEEFRYDRLAGKLAEVLNATISHAS
jgi:glycosyltransferase involved in cell wall biosynthesis